jgi:hypothetical protein
VKKPRYRPSRQIFEDEEAIGIEDAHRKSDLIMMLVCRWDGDSHDHAVCGEVTASMSNSLKKPAIGEQNMFNLAQI